MDRFEVLGNTLLSSNVIARILAPYTGDGVRINRKQNHQWQWPRCNWSISARLCHREGHRPPHKGHQPGGLFQVTEGRLAAVKIAHNRYYSSNNIMAALPYVKSLESGQRILNSKVFQIGIGPGQFQPRPPNLA